VVAGEHGRPVRLSFFVSLEIVQDFIPLVQRKFAEELHSLSAYVAVAPQPSAVHPKSNEHENDDYDDSGQCYQWHTVTPPD
jgi:hypothetical protein